MKQAIKKSLVVLSIALATTIPSVAHAAPSTPAKPEGNGWVLGCYMGIGTVRGISTNVPLCNALHRPLYWFHRAVK